MPEKRLEKTRHDFLIVDNSDVAPFTGPTGLCTTWWLCIDCGQRKSYTRTQEQFEKEIGL